MLLHNTFLLTLSQLEPQINLKSNLLIFVIKVLGIISGNIDALYIIRDDKVCSTPTLQVQQAVICDANEIDLNDSLGEEMRYDNTVLLIRI